MGHVALIHGDSVGRKHSRQKQQQVQRSSGGRLSCLGPPGGHLSLNKMLQRKSCRRQSQQGKEGRSRGPCRSWEGRGFLICVLCRTPVGFAPRSAGPPRTRQGPGVGCWAVSSLCWGQGTKAETERLAEKLMRECEHVLMARAPSRPQPWCVGSRQERAPSVARARATAAPC